MKEYSADLEFKVNTRAERTKDDSQKWVNYLEHPSTRDAVSLPEDVMIALTYRWIADELDGLYTVLYVGTGRYYFARGSRKEMIGFERLHRNGSPVFIVTPVILTDLDELTHDSVC